MSVGKNNWRVRGRFHKTVSAHNDYLSDVINQRAGKATFVGIESSLEGRKVDYLSAIVAGITFDVAPQTTRRPQTDLRFDQLSIVKQANATRQDRAKLQLAGKITARAMLPLVVQHPLAELRFVVLRMQNTTGSVLAELRDVELVSRPVMDGNDAIATIAGKEILTLDVLDPAGLERLANNDAFKISGTAEGQVDTRAGLVKVDFAFNQDIPLRVQ